jgi:hypothetical protein
VDERLANAENKAMKPLISTYVSLLLLGFAGGSYGQSFEGTKPLAEYGDNVSGFPDYQRDEYISSWIDEDGDCQNLRHGMLILHSQREVTFTNSNRCAVTEGLWLDPYLGKLITMASDLDVDHVIPLAYVHANGGADWSISNKQRFVVDETNLLLVDDGENQSKGAKGPSEYLPRKEFQCAYAQIWQLVATKYELEVPHTDSRVLLNISTECSGL